MESSGARPRSAMGFLDQRPIFLGIPSTYSRGESVNPVATHRVLGSTRRDPKYQDNEESAADLQLGPRRIPSTCAPHTRKIYTSLCTRRRRSRRIEGTRGPNGYHHSLYNSHIPFPLRPLSLISRRDLRRAKENPPSSLLPFHERFSISATSFLFHLSPTLPPSYRRVHIVALPVVSNRRFEFLNIFRLPAPLCPSDLSPCSYLPCAPFRLL